MSNKELIGLWKLISFEMKNAQGEISTPFGQDPLGYIMYLENGFMSAHLAKKNRNTANAKVLEDVSPEERKQMLESYFSYCGRFEVKDDFVHHFVQLSTFQNQVGTTLVRRYQLEKDRLTLSADIETGSGKQFFTAVWGKGV